MMWTRTYFALVVVFLSLFVLVGLSPAQDPIGGNTYPVPPAQEAIKKFEPTYFATEFWVTPDTFVGEETIMLTGVVAFDQIFSVHWEDFSQDRLKLDPFKVLRVTVGPQRPHSQNKNFFADERTVAIHLVLGDVTKREGLKIPAIRIGYSWFDGVRTIKKSATLGPWKISRVPIRISGSISADVLHLGEQAELRVDIVREKGIRVLNQFLGILNDEKALETEKGETQRWMKSLEARKEFAFNLVSPDIKPMKVVKRNYEEIDRGLIVMSRYRYTISYYL